MDGDDDYGKTGFALRLVRLRVHQIGIPQWQFAERYGLSLGAVRDLEQGRSNPSRAMLILVSAIEADPKWMAKIAKREMHDDVMQER